MWSREGLRSTQSMYCSTPHLFVYQPSSDYDDTTMMSSYDCDGGSSVSTASNTEPSSDSGYADSQPSSSDVVIYCNSEREKDAVRRLSQKFIVKQQETTNSSSNSSSSCSGSDVADVTVSAAHDQLTELELLRVETFFRGNRTQVFVGKSLANL